MFWSPFAGRLLDKFDIRIITVVAVAIPGGLLRRAVAGRRGWVRLLRAGRHRWRSASVMFATMQLELGPHDDQPLVWG